MDVMIEQLLPNISAALSQLFKDLPDISLADLKPLAGGYSNATNFIFQHKSQEILIRLFSPQQTSADRNREIITSKSAANLKIAPEVFYADGDFMLLEFIQNASMLTARDYQEKSILIQLVKVLQTLHNQKISSIPTCKNLLKGFQNKLANSQSHKLPIPSEIDAVKDFMQNGFDNIEKSIKNFCLIHNDFNLENILIKNHKIYVIDWANAGVGDPYADLADVCIFLPTQLQYDFLSHYLERESTIDERAHLLCRIQLRYAIFIAWALEQASLYYQKDFPVIAWWQQQLHHPLFENVNELLQAVTEKSWMLHDDDPKTTCERFVTFAAIMYKGIKI